MPVGNLPGAGYDPELVALLTVDADLGLLGQKLDQARRQTAGAFSTMARDAERGGRRMGFAVQNFGYQVQDFVVQVSSGTSALRAFAQQAPQAIAAFGGFTPQTAIISSVVATVVALGAAWLASGRDGAAAKRDIDALAESVRKLGTDADGAADQVEKIARAFFDASGEAQKLRGVQINIDLRDSQRRLEDAKTALADIIDTLVRTEQARQTFIGGVDEQSAGLLQLAQRAKDGQISVEDFIDEFTKFADAPRPDAGPFKDITRATFDAAKEVQDLTKQVDDLSQAQKRVGEGRVVSREPFGPPEPPRATGGRAVLDEQARSIEQMTTKLRDLRTELQVVQAGGSATELGRQLKDLGDAARTFDLTPTTVKDAPLQIRELVQAYVDLQVEIRRTTDANKEAADADAATAAAAQEAADAQIRAEREKQASIDAERSSRQGRITAGSRLPNDIDVANIAAGELSSTLADVSNLSFESLGEAIASIAQQIAQAALQALIFKAIMGGIGGIGGASGFAATPAGGGGGSTTLVGGIPQFSHGGVFAHGRLATAQHGAVFRRGEMALMTGRTSGAALLEGAGDEAAVPLVTLPSGKLGVSTSGGGGGGAVINVDARGAVPGMQAMIENGVRRALASSPAYSQNARERGLVRDEKRPAF